MDGGFTCPNRDGTKGTDGCAYCNNNAFNPSYCNSIDTIHSQITKGIDFHAVRYRRSDRFLVYFQPYSNTYAPVDQLRRLFESALNYPDVEGLVIGTRPDCMNDDIFDYLQELSKRTFIQVEYGVESCYDKTLFRINRGHDFKTSEATIRETHERGIRTGVHMIFGLPGESIEEMLDEADILSSLPINSIKFHQLQIVKDTLMEKEFCDNPGEFVIFALEEYIDFIIRFIERLSSSILIERFSGEVPPKYLHHTNWSLIRYDVVLRLIEAELERRNTWQGKHFLRR